MQIQNLLDSDMQTVEFFSFRAPDIGKKVLQYREETVPVGGTLDLPSRSLRSLISLCTDKLFKSSADECKNEDGPHLCTFCSRPRPKRKSDRLNASFSWSVHGALLRPASIGPLSMESASSFRIMRRSLSRSWGEG